MTLEAEGAELRSRASVAEESRTATRQVGEHETLCPACCSEQAAQARTLDATYKQACAQRQAVMTGHCIHFYLHPVLPGLFWEGKCGTWDGSRDPSLAESPARSPPSHAASTLALAHAPCSCLEPKGKNCSAAHPAATCRRQAQVLLSLTEQATRLQVEKAQLAEQLQERSLEIEDVIAMTEHISAADATLQQVWCGASAFASRAQGEGD